MARYLYSLLITLSLVLLAVVALNRLVNPYDIFAGPEIASFNREKPEVKTRQRMSKAYQVANLKPEAIILGTSRALALDAHHPHWRQQRCFNLALTSSSIYEQLRYLQHAQAVSPLREVVIGMDHFMFNHRTGANFKEGRLATLPDGRPQYHLFGFEGNDLIAALLSFDALRSSLVTIDQQEEVDAVADRRRRIVSNGGHWGMFTEMERTLFQEYSTRPDAQGDEIGTYDRPGSFRRILRLAHQNYIRLHLFISPSHARMWEVWRIVGIDDAIDKWKRAMVEANEEEARFAGSAPFPLWDFSGYNRVTTERLPSAGEIEQIMYGYWEGSHYSDAVGGQILDRLFGEKSQGGDDFGMQLTSANIDAHLEQIRSEGARYRLAHAAAIKAMEEMFDYYRRKQPAQ